jgi:hypothetical protein
MFNATLPIPPIIIQKIIVLIDQNLDFFLFKLTCLPQNFNNNNNNNLTKRRTKTKINWVLGLISILV